MLRYLCDLEIIPGAKLFLTERGPFDGPSMLQVGDAPEIRALGSRVAGQIHVVPGADAAQGSGGAPKQRD
jgi:hypothetical protein